MKRALITSVVALLLVAACSDSEITAPKVRSLAQAEALWNKSAPTTYSMEQYRDCFCGDRGVLYLVEVANGQVRRATNTSTGRELTAEERQWLHSVPQLFEDIRNALNTRDATVDVEYDPVSGVPKTLWIDPTPKLADEEFGYRTANILRLPD